MIDYSIFKGGEYRITLPLYVLLPLYFLPSLLMTGIITAPNEKLSTTKKQLLSIPLLAVTFMAPFGFTYSNKMIEILSAANNVIFLRFLELFWVAPLVQHRPAYATFDSLWIDVWGCLRIFPKPAKKDTPELKKGQVKEYKKDKKYYHLFVYLSLHLLIVDILGSWVATFTAHDAISMRQERPVLFFVFFVACMTLMSSAFNLFGYSMHLIYCILFEQGSYSSEQWRPLIYNPILSSTLDDLWSVRWHRLFKSTWIAFPFRPTYILTERFFTKKVKHPKSIAFALASISVFFASGFMHEYMVACNIGWPLYSRFFMGQEMFFFVIHGLGVFVEHTVAAVVGPKLSKEVKNSMFLKIIKYLWVAAFGYSTFYYFINGFLQWGFHLDNPIVFSQPYLVQFAKAHPPLLSYFGSLA